MNICSFGHPEVVFDDKDCPVCKIRQDLESEIVELQMKIADLQNEIEQGGA